MNTFIPNTKVTALDVATSLGLYLSERLKGAFKDSFITFSETPQLQTVAGTLKNRLNAMERSKWGMSTDLQAVFALILGMATKHRLAQEDLPSKILIISDMEFNTATRINGWGNVKNDTNFAAIKAKYKLAGYEMPQLVFWNVMARNTQNVPVKATQKDVALVSGFSPAVVKSVLGNATFTPYDVMLDTLMRDRYNLAI